MISTRRRFLETGIAGVAAAGIVPGIMPALEPALAAQQNWTSQEHPRLFFDRSEIAALRGKRRADALAAAAWQRVEEEIEKGMALEQPRTSERWEWDTGADRQKNLSWVAGTLELARHHPRTLVAAGRRGRACPQGSRPADGRLRLRFLDQSALSWYRIPRPMARNARDCTPLSRSRLRLRLALQFQDGAGTAPASNLPAYKGALPLVQDWADPLTRFHLPAGNWWPNCVAPAGEAAIALYGEHPLAERFVRLCSDAMEAWFNYKGGTVDDLPKELRRDPPGTYYPPNFDSRGGTGKWLT